MHEARFYEKLSADSVRCTLCPHNCRIGPGGRGACAVRYNDGGTLYTLVYDKVVAREVNPIEKKPFFHFQPGSRAYSISTVGCTLRCAFCQNWDISQWPKAHLPRRIDTGESHAGEPICPQLALAAQEVPGETITPEEIVRAALGARCQSVSYTFTEPTIFYELAYDTAVLARAHGLRNTFVSNGFINEAPIRQLATVLDAVNVDLKFFREESYRRVSRAQLGPILDAIRLYHQLGVWVEVTTLIVPDLNDSDEELTQIAEFVYSVDPAIPWHVTQFYPAYRMLDREPTPVPSLVRAREIGRNVGLRYVYEGNVPGEGGENTFCYACEALLVERFGMHLLSNRITDERCPDCGAHIDGVEVSGARHEAQQAAKPVR